MSLCREVDEKCVLKNISFRCLQTAKGLTAINTSKSVYFLVFFVQKDHKKTWLFFFRLAKQQKHFSIIKKATIFKLYEQFCLNENRGLLVILLFYWSQRLWQLLVIWFFEKFLCNFNLEWHWTKQNAKDCRKRVNAAIALEMPVKCFFFHGFRRKLLYDS